MNSSLLAPVEPPVKLAYKWKQGTSKPSEASIEEIEQFIYWRIDKYKEFGWKNEDLSEAYASDFQHFTKDEFDKCSDDPIRKLRDVLRAQGVYIRKGRGINIARELTAVIQDDIPWPEDDPERPISTRTPLAHSTAPAAPTTLATLTQNPTSGTQLHNNSRELTTLAKLYTSDEHKYKGDLLDSFDYKYTIFIDNCQKAAIPPEILPQAFSTMLSGPPLEYYYTNCRNQNMTITDLYNRYRDHFEGNEHRRNILREWNDITLRKMTRDQPDQPHETTFRNMVQKLQQLQRGLDNELRTESTLRNKIISACEDMEACRVAIARPATTFTGLVNDIFSAICSHTKVTKADKLESTSTNFITDRRYHSNHHRAKNPNRTKTLNHAVTYHDNDNYPRAIRTLPTSPSTT
jgi:hypothetical protein